MDKEGTLLRGGPIAVLRSLRLFGLFVTLVSAGTSGLDTAAITPATSTATSAAGTSGLWAEDISCWTGSCLAAAVANPIVRQIVIQNDITLYNSDWAPFSLPLVVHRNLTVASPSMYLPFVLDMAFLGPYIRMANNTAIKFRTVVLKNFRRGSLSQAPGLSMLDPLPPGENAFIALESAYIIYALCLPPSVARDSSMRLQRIPEVPGVNRYLSPAPWPADCTHDTTAPIIRRCWDRVSLYEDFAVYSYDVDEGSGRLSRNGYTMIVTYVFSLCDGILTEECIARLTPVGCELYTASLLTAPHHAAADPAAAPGAGGSGRRTLAIALGCSLGGVALLGVLAGLLAMYVAKRRRRRRDGPEFKSDVGAGEELRQQQQQQKNEDAQICATGGTVSFDDPVDAVPLTRHYSPPAVPDGASEADPDDAVVTPHTPFRSDLLLNLRLVAASAGRPPASAATPAAASAGSIRLTPLDGKSAQQPHSGEAVAAEAGVAPAAVAAAAAAAAAAAPAGGDELQGGCCGIGGVEAGSNEVTLRPVVLGKGSFGRVYEGTYRGQRVAVKVFSDAAYPVDDPQPAGGPGGEGRGEAPPGGPAELAPQPPGKRSPGGVPPDGGEAPDPQLGQSTIVRMLHQEVEVLGRCQHPNVVRLLAACLTPPRFCLVMELMETNLEELVYRDYRNRLLPLPTVLHISAQICEALQYLHPTIVHRDLKPANVLLKGANTSYPIAKVADFGLSRIRTATHRTKTPEAGTPVYLAPECYDVRNDVITHHADIYAFAVLLWAMLTGQEPWQNCPVVVMAFNVSMRRQRPPLEFLSDQRCPPSLKQLVCQCWEHDPFRRPAAAEVLKQLILVQQQL